MNTFQNSKGFSLSKLRGTNNEGILLLVILILIAGMSMMSASFFTPNTFLAIVRSMIVPMVFALSVLVVIISGGIDVSFPAIAIFAAYTTAKLADEGILDIGLIAIFLVAMLIGACLGLVNGVIIARFRLPTLIVTLGTQTIFKGALVAYIGSKYIPSLVPELTEISRFNIFSIQTDVGVASLHVLVIPVILLSILVAFLLNKTMFGRGVYAIGGDIEAARRAGFPVVSIQVRLYILSGVLAAIGGMFHVILNRSANSQDIVGIELDIIAAVVLGGASIFGGKGSVVGTVLGVFLIQLINNTLILIGIPGVWQRASVGIMLILGVTVQALTMRKSRRRNNMIAPLEEVKVAK